MMRYVAIDIETTGLNPETCQVLELAAVIETDWRSPVESQPTFRALCNPGEIRGEPTALAMNARLLQEIAGGGGDNLHNAVCQLAVVIQRHLGTESVTIAGKNFGAFDYQFLKRATPWWKVHHKHRFIDVGNLWWNPETDTCLPNLAECVSRAGLTPRPEHSAVEDCRSVIELVRAWYARRES